MKLRSLILTASVLSAVALQAAGVEPATGSIDDGMLGRLRDSYRCEGPVKALRNAIMTNDIDKLAANADVRNDFDRHFSIEVNSRGITDQKSSGRCWLFTGLNVLRAQMMARHDLADLKLSQNYNFFYDQLEKANLFLQAMIDNAGAPDDDRRVDWLFANPMSDGGQYTGLSDNLMKYGVVPAGIMAETYSSENTSKLRNLLSLKLREWGLELRKMHAAGATPQQLAARKEEMLGTVYRMLALTLGEPPVQFQWTRRNTAGEVVDTRTYTPLEFYNTYAGNDLKNDYVMLMNDPSREFYTLYEIDYDRHAYDGRNWTYINLPMEEIKRMAIASLRDSAMMYFSCDVGKTFDRQRGLLDVDNYDYESLFGTTFGMDKAERIRTHASASSHAMTLMAVDLDENGNPLKWKVENSWGPGPNDGHLIMTDRWFDEYMFRLVVNKKYLSDRTRKVLDQTPVTLPAWDPLFAPDI